MALVQHLPAFFEPQRNATRLLSANQCARITVAAVEVLLLGRAAFLLQS